jgi:hypothetical protein
LSHNSWTATALVATVWVSVALFGLYILAFYAGALLDGELEGWNEVLPRLYEPTTPAATAGIALHFAAGGVILVLEAHRAWSLRLFALAIGSWLYRMDYGFWLLLTDGWGHTADFRGPFDVVMAFFFYLPNLIVTELFIRARRGGAPPVLRFAAAGVLAAATGFLLIGTYFFTAYLWGPAILYRLLG